MSTDKLQKQLLDRAINETINQEKLEGNNPSALTKEKQEEAITRLKEAQEALAQDENWRAMTEEESNTWVNWCNILVPNNIKESTHSFFLRGMSEAFGELAPSFNISINTFPQRLLEEFGLKNIKTARDLNKNADPGVTYKSKIIKLDLTRTGNSNRKTTFQSKWKNALIREVLKQDALTEMVVLTCIYEYRQQYLGYLPNYIRYMVEGYFPEVAK